MNKFSISPGKNIAIDGVFRVVADREKYIGLLSYSQR